MMANAEDFVSDRLVPFQLPVYIDRVTQKLWTPLNGIPPPQLPLPQPPTRDAQSPHSIHSLGALAPAFTPTPMNHTPLTESKEEDKKEDSEIMVLYAGPALLNQEETVMQKDVCMLCVQLLAGRRGRFSASFATPEEKRAHAEIHANQCGEDVVVTLRKCFPELPAEEDGVPATAAALLEREEAEEGPESSKSVWDAYEERLGELRGILPCTSLHCQKEDCSKILWFGGKVSGIEEHLMAHLLGENPTAKLHDIQADRKAFGGDLWEMVEECFPKEEVGERVVEMRKRCSGANLRTKCQMKDCQTSVLPNGRHGHVLTHFQRPIYECRLCPYKGDWVLDHVQKNHTELEQPDDAIVDNRKVHKVEIQKLEAVCFPKSPPPVTKPAVEATESRPKSEQKSKKRSCPVVKKSEENAKKPKKVSMKEWVAEMVGEVVEMVADEGGFLLLVD